MLQEGGMFDANRISHAACISMILKLKPVIVMILKETVRREMEASKLDITIERGSPRWGDRSPPKLWRGPTCTWILLGIKGFEISIHGM